MARATEEKHSSEISSLKLACDSIGATTKASVDRQREEMINRIQSIKQLQDETVRTFSAQNVLDSIVSQVENMSSKQEFEQDREKTSHAIISLTETTSRLQEGLEVEQNFSKVRYLFNFLIL